MKNFLSYLSGEDAMSPLSIEEANKILISCEYDPNNLPFNISDFIEGYLVELEHGSKAPKPQLNITKDNPILIAKIALTHLEESKNYYKLLREIEESF